MVKKQTTAVVSPSGQVVGPLHPKVHGCRLQSTESCSVEKEKKELLMRYSVSSFPTYVHKNLSFSSSRWMPRRLSFSSSRWMPRRFPCHGPTSAPIISHKFIFSVLNNIALQYFFKVREWKNTHGTQNHPIKQSMWFEQAEYSGPMVAYADRLGTAAEAMRY